MADTLRICLAQLNLVVGVVAGNTARIATSIRQAREEQAADLVVFKLILGQVADIFFDFFNLSPQNLFFGTQGPYRCLFHFDDLLHVLVSPA